MYDIIVQRAVSDIYIPKITQLKNWAKTVLEKEIPSAEVTIRVVDKNEISHLNHTYRKKNKATNVLSFPFEMPNDVDIATPILGDIVICAEVIKEEALAQNKKLDAHWAHMVVHGTLHLLGYDHEKEQDADEMEAQEVRLLKLLGFDNPYQEKR